MVKSMDDRGDRSFSAPGGSALMVIFAVLCLTVFAILSLATVLADGRLASASRQAVSAYYRADCAAEETLARLRSGEVPPGVAVSGSIYSYEVAVSDTQALMVSAEIDGESCLVLRWQLEYTAAWQADEHMNVWSGE